MRTLKQKQKGQGWLTNRLKGLRRLVTGRYRSMKPRSNLPRTMKLATKGTEKRETKKALNKRPKILKQLNKLLYKEGELKPVPNQPLINKVGLEITNEGNLPEGALEDYYKGQNLNRLGMANLPFVVKTPKEKKLLERIHNKFFGVPPEEAKVYSKNKRDPFSLEEAKIPDANLPDPGPIPYAPTRSPVGNNDNKETQVQAQIRVLPVFYALWRGLMEPRDILDNDYDTVIDSLAGNNYPTHISQIPEDQLKQFLQAVADTVEQARERFGNPNFNARRRNVMVAEQYAPQPRTENALNEYLEGERSRLQEVEKQKDNFVSTTLFRAPYDVMQPVLERLEYAGPTKEERYIVDTMERLVDGTYRPIQKIAVGGAVYFARYIGFLSSGYENIKLLEEHDSMRCMRPIIFRLQRPNEYTGNRVPDPIYRPLTTLKSNECITIVRGIENFLKIASMAIDNQSLYGSWIVLNKAYFPFKQGSEGGGGGPSDILVAKAFPYASFIQKALQDWAIDAIDPAFYSLLDIKYPFYAMKISTYIATPERFLRLRESVRRDRVDYPVGQGQFEFVNFMLIDEDILKENTTFLVHINPFEGVTKVNDLVTKAVELQAVYGISPYIAYFMKRKYLSAYYRAFKSRDTDFVQRVQVYNVLPEQEKITYDFLEYLLFLDRFQGVVLQPLNGQGSRKNQLQNRFKQVRSVYTEPMNQNRLARMMALYTAEYQEALTMLQTMVDSQTPPNTNPAFLRSILEKFLSRMPTNNNMNFEARRLNTMYPRLVVQRRGELFTVKTQIDVLKREKANLQKQWNPFKAKTRKQRINQINANLNRLEANLRVKQRLLNNTLEQVQNTERQLLQKKPATQTRRQARAPPVRSVYQNAPPALPASGIVGLAPAENPFNNDF